MTTRQIRGGGRVQGGQVQNEAGFFRFITVEQFNAALANEQQAREVTGNMGEFMRSHAFTNAPFRTGRLRNTIKGGSRVREGRLEAYVSVNESGEAPYWFFQEYGTQSRGKAAAQPLFVGRGYRHSDRSGGIYPKAFMRGALVALQGAVQNGNF